MQLKESSRRVEPSYVRSVPLHHVLMHCVSMGRIRCVVNDSVLWQVGTVLCSTSWRQAMRHIALPGTGERDLWRCASPAGSGCCLFSLARTTAALRFWSWQYSRHSPQYGGHASSGFTHLGPPWYSFPVSHDVVMSIAFLNASTAGIILRRHRREPLGSLRPHEMHPHR